MEKQSPLISVIMPLYNAERFVGESICNILGQTVGDFELIVIDDASTDSSYDIASRYAAQDARIVLMRNDANHGAAYTRNRGLETARGSFITFMDADDRCSPERFARQTAFFGQHPQIDLCGSYYTMFGPDDAREQKIQDPTTHEGIRIQMLFGCPFAMSGVMMRRGAFLRSGVRFRATMAEDYLFWAELSGHMRMANIPEHLSFYRRWENQLSTSQLDRQTLSAQAIQRDLLRTTLGMTLTDEESRIYTQMNLRVGTLRCDELTTYRGLLKRLYRANSERRAYDPKLLRKRLVYRYKLACKCFYPSWTVKIRKRLLWLELR